MFLSNRSETTSGIIYVARWERWNILVVQRRIQAHDQGIAALPQVRCRFQGEYGKNHKLIVKQKRRDTHLD